VLSIEASQQGDGWQPRYRGAASAL